MNAVYCPFCRTEYQGTVTHCPNCRVRLVDVPPEAGARFQPVEEVPIARFSALMEAEMCGQVLEEAGIPVVLVPLGPGVAGFGTSLWIPHELRVRADDAQRARAILAEFRKEGS